MTKLEQALAGVAGFLDAEGIPYMVIGGIANLVWGTPRATVDIDVTVWVDNPGIDTLVNKLSARFRILIKNASAFVRHTRVLPLETPEGIGIELIFGQLPYEREAIDRARTQVFHGVPVRICSPEDLIIHKIISERPRDREDVKGIIQAMGNELDRQFLDRIIQGLAMDLERPDILSFYNSCWASRQQP